MTSEGKCLGVVKWEMQGHNFSFYLRVIELGSYDIHGFGHGLADNLKYIYIRCEHLHL